MLAGTAQHQCLVRGKQWRHCLSRGKNGAMVLGAMVLCKGGNKGIYACIPTPNRESQTLNTKC
jgi:hypothetical protein